MGYIYANRARWDRFAHLCPFAAEVPANVVPPISLALAPSIAIDIAGRGVTRFRFKRRSDRDKFVAAWRHKGARSGIGRAASPPPPNTKPEPQVKASEQGRGT